MTNLLPVHECQGQAAEYQFRQAAWPKDEKAPAGTAMWLQYPCSGQEYPLIALFSCYTGAVTPVERPLVGWQEIGGSTEKAFEAQMSMIAQLYEFRDPQAVRTFLRSNRSILPLLQAARAKIGETFTNRDPVVTLQVINDPDDPDTSRLVAYIHTDLKPVEAIARLDKFDDWWAAASREADDKVIVDLEYTD